MNKDLIREKLSNTIETIEQTKTIVELNYEKKYEVDFTSYKRRVTYREEGEASGIR